MKVTHINSDAVIHTHSSADCSAWIAINGST